MSMDAQDFLSLVESWGCDAASDEAVLRTATSRAYYAALHRALDALPGNFFPPSEKRRGTGSHNAVVDGYSAWARSFGGGANSPVAIVAKQLPRMKLSRVRADYHLNDNYPLEDCVATLGRSRKVFDELGKLDAASDENVVSSA